MRKLLLTSLLAGACMLAASAAHAVTYPPGFEEQTLVSGLTRPTAVAFAPDGRRFVTEKDGRLRVAAPGATTASTLRHVDPSKAGGNFTERVNDFHDRGLLGLAIDSSFASNGYLYLLYTYDLKPLGSSDSGAPMVSQLLRVKVDAASRVVEDQVLLGSYTDGPCPPAADPIDCIPSDGLSHSIGTVRSAPDGTLWVGSGDASSWAEVDPLAFRAYDEMSMAGKLMHVDREGRGLPDHPFCPANANLDHVCTKLHAKGLRNPFRFELRPGGGLVLGDVGWNSHEEIDLVSEGGRSYGWPCYEGPIRTPGYRDHASCTAEYAKEATGSAQTGPDYAYPNGPDSAAVMGGPTYTGDAYPSGYQGSIFVGDYGKGFVKRLVVSESGLVQEEAFAGEWAGVQLERSPAGNLVYVSMGDFTARTGSIREVLYSPENLSPDPKLEAAPTTGPAPLEVSFDASGSSDPDGDALAYSWDFGDGSPPSTAVSPSHTYTAVGNYTARLTVSDERGKSATRTVNISAGNEPPVAAISHPADYRAGQPVDLHGSANDPQDGSLPASAYRWNVTLVHGDHLHEFGEYDGTKALSFTPTPDHDADSHYAVKLTVTDSHEVDGTHTVTLRPATAALRLDSEPRGIALSYDGREVVTPYETLAGVGFRTTVTAPAELHREGRLYDFVSWADGGERLHTIEVPPGGMDLLASFRERTAPTGGLATAAPALGGKPSPRDRMGPRLDFSARRGLDARRGLLLGTVADPAGIRSLEVAVGRAVRSGRCRWWAPSKAALAAVATSCGRPRWMKATLRPTVGKNWRWQLPLRRRPLPVGGYRLLFRARDRAGNETRSLASGRRLVRLHVRASTPRRKAVR